MESQLEAVQSGRTPRHESPERIAIIGISARFPGASSLSEHWKNLADCRDMVRETPPDRWDWRTFHGDPASGDHTLINQAAFIENVDKFDARFFGISPREAKLMDPHQRLMLESAWHCIEDAGYRASDLATSNTGVFAAVRKSDYEELIFRAAAPVDATTGTGLGASIVANRISYLLDLRGPSLTVDTACSGSMIALHLAAQSLNAGECSMALVGGVNVILTPTLNIAFDKAGLLSRSCRSKTFDESADGYCRGEGVVTLLLKKLTDAEQSGDHIYGVILGSAISHSGRTKSLTAPSSASQTELIKRAVRRAGVDPKTITYIEAHGTGTPRGDSIEFRGIREAFEELDREAPVPAAEPHRCGIGSVKANIGHLEAASGLAGVVKVLLSMKYGLLPGNPHLKNPNPFCKTEGSPFYFFSKSETWARIWNSQGRAIPRRAGVSAFGFGGSSAHFILEEYHPDDDAVGTGSASVLPLLPLSAQDDAALRRLAEQTRNFIISEALSQNDRKEGPSVCSVREFLYTFQVGRDPMKSRLAVLGDSWEALSAGLGHFIEGRTDGSVLSTGTPSADAPNSRSDNSPKNIFDLAKRWVNGEQVEFKSFYGERPCRRASLPGYPFSSTRFWFNADESEGQLQSKRAADLSGVTRRPSEVSSKWGVDASNAVSVDIVDKHIAIVTLNDASRSNMFDRVMIDSLRSCFTQIEESDLIRVIVIAANKRAFCMGGPPSWLLEIAQGERSFKDEPFLYQGFLSSKVPVIAAIEGHAFGGGLLLGLYADIPILANQSLYSANFMQFGFTPGMGATVLLKERLGTSLANEMMMTARAYRGEELKSRGAGVLIVDQSEVMTQAMEMARAISGMPQLSVRALKRELSHELSALVNRQVDREDQLHREVVAKPHTVSLVQSQLARLALNDTIETAEVTVAMSSRGNDEKSEPAIGTVELSETPDVSHDANPNLRREICDIVAKVLHLDRSEFAEETPLRELGFDSVNAVEVASAVARQFAVQLVGSDLAEVVDCVQLAASVAHLRSAGNDVKSDSGQATIENKVVRPRVELASLSVVSPVYQEERAAPPAMTSGDRHHLKSNQLEQVFDIVAQVLHLDRSEFGADTPLKDLGFDSINAVEVASAVARRFGIKLVGAELADVLSCAQLTDVIVSNQGSGSKAAPNYSDVDNVADALALGELSVDAALDRLMSA